MFSQTCAGGMSRPRAREAIQQGTRELVKINLALGELPDFAATPEPVLARVNVLLVFP
jgi:hypothetical protein